MAKKFQIRSGDFGLALYEADTAREALLSFFADKTKGEMRGKIEEDANGDVTADFNDVTYKAVSV